MTCGAVTSPPEAKWRECRPLPARTGASERARSEHYNRIGLDHCGGNRQSACPKSTGMLSTIRDPRW